MRAFERALPRLAAQIPRVSIGTWPTPLVPLLPGVWVKDEGASNALYGGNKVRTLEVWLGIARDRGARRIWSIGAYGSNHAIATILHAKAAGLEAGAIVFPQPTSEWARENCGAIIDSGCPVIRLRSVIEVPFAQLLVGRRPGEVVMPPGGATTLGAFGALAAAFELAEQIEAGVAPPPRRIVLAIGSTCTTAGLLAGFALAHAAGVWRWPAPIIHGVRVTPWPVTSRLRIAEYAQRTLAHAEALGGPPVAITLGELYARLVVDGNELGPGYGRLTPRGEAAIAELATTGSDAAIAELSKRRGTSSRARDGDAATSTSSPTGGGIAASSPRLDGVYSAKALANGEGIAASSPRLDGVYSAKAAAAMLRLYRAGEGPLVFWASKSTALLPAPSSSALRAAPFAIRKWLAGS